MGWLMMGSLQWLDLTVSLGAPLAGESTRGSGIDSPVTGG
jgi:hypothetical protein